MTTTIILECNACHTPFLKEKKEHTRRLKLGIENFFCSLKCAGTKTKLNLPSEWCRSEENKNHMRHHAANKKYPIEDKPFYEYLRRARARKKGETDLSISFLKHLWHQQNGKCALSNIPLLHVTKDYNSLSSLDRIDSSKGYVRGNVQFISCALNWAKSNRADDSILDLLAKIVKYSKV